MTGDDLRRFRASRNWTHAQLAARLRVTARTIARNEARPLIAPRLSKRVSALWTETPPAIRGTAKSANEKRRRGNTHPAP